MDRLNVDLTLLELKQIVEALRYKVRVSNHPARQSREYANHLTELANKLEKLIMSK